MAAPLVSEFERHSRQHYARVLRPQLPAAVFEPAWQRLAWLPVHLGVIIALGAYIVVAQPPWYLALLAAIVAGHSWTCLAFLAHETLHHAITANRVVERLVGYCGLLIFCLSPTLWVAWHNQAHHGNTANPARDPDTMGTLASWHADASDRAVVRAAPGSGSLWSVAFPFFTFSVHSLVVLFVHAPRHNYWARVSRRAVYAETAAMVAFWIAVYLLVGPWNFLFLYGVPLLVANAVAMSYVATNHFLSSLTATNDPLVNSLTVTAPRWIEWLHLGFGYHVEHHLFPTVSARHAHALREAIVREYGDRYLALPHTRALRLLYTRPKAHDTADTLVDPHSGATYRTLAPGQLAMAPVPTAARTAATGAAP